MTTHTPGDNEVKENNVNNLSARHAATLQTMIHQSDDGAICICAECRALKYAIAALSALPVAGDGWRPIESAPREKLVLLANEHNGAVGCGHMDARGAWWWSHHPTHWQPLLAAPAATPTDR